MHFLLAAQKMLVNFGLCHRARFARDSFCFMFFSLFKCVQCTALQLSLSLSSSAGHISLDAYIKFSFLSLFYFVLVFFQGASNGFVVYTPHLRQTHQTRCSGWLRFVIEDEKKHNSESRDQRQKKTTLAGAYASETLVIGLCAGSQQSALTWHVWFAGGNCVWVYYKMCVLSMQ